MPSGRPVGRGSARPGTHLHRPAACGASRTRPSAPPPAGSLALPVGLGAYRLPAGFGDEGRRWSTGRHTGLAFAAPIGTPVVASGSGTVTVEHPAWAGNLVRVDHGGGVETWYAHLSRVDVVAGNRSPPEPRWAWSAIAATPVVLTSTSRAGLRLAPPGVGSCGWQPTRTLALRVRRRRQVSFAPPDREGTTTGACQRQTPVARHPAGATGRLSPGSARTTEKRRGRSSRGPGRTTPDGRRSRS